MLKLKQTRKSQAGDTIIEVLIALTIIALVMVISYKTVDDSILNFENQRENSQAAAIVQSQIEALHVYDGTGTLDCFNNSGVPQASPLDCLFDGSGNSPADSQAQPTFKIQISFLPSQGDYEVSASWTSLNNNSANITMYYGNQ